MYDSSDLIEYSDDELNAELNRRDELRHQPWPRKTTVSCEAIDGDGILSEFLLESCGFCLNSEEYVRALNSLDDVELEVEVSKNGNTKVIGLAATEPVVKAPTDNDTLADTFRDNLR